MQFQPPPLRKRLLTSMLPRLFGLILVVALMLFAFAFFFCQAADRNGTTTVY